MTIFIDLRSDDWVEKTLQFIEEEKVAFERAMSERAADKAGRFELAGSLHEQLNKGQEFLIKMHNLVDTLPSMPDVARARIYDNVVWLYIPANVGIFRRVRKALGKNYKRQYVTQHSQSMSVSFAPISGDNHRIVIDMAADAEGATCRIEKVGEVVQPVFKMVCK